ncbi:MAG TPA: cytochrome c biogenesis protein CcsA [Myxococcales bacterium]|nr:cytochrome c biogenesis protein CcsA [Myxococcales bacterium]
MLEDLLQLGVGLRVAAVGAYAGAFAGYASSLAIDRRLLKRAATLLAVVGATAHTAYLVARWIAAGEVEILARERTGDVLSAMDRAWYMISHPPFTNLFDALNFTAWAMMICWLVMQRKFAFQVLGALAAAVALVAMGEAMLVSDQAIEPLVPALQSYWILIHVAMLFVSYALFTLGAAAALLYLVRAGTTTRVLGRAQAAVVAVLLSLIGGSALLFGARFEMAPSFMHQVPSRLRPGKFLDVVAAVHTLDPVSGKQAKLLLPVPGVGPLLLAALVLFAAAAVIYSLKNREKLGLRVLASGFAALSAGIAVLLVQIASSTTVELPAGVQPVEPGPYFFGIASNYALGLLALLWGTTLGFLITARWRPRIEGALPDARRLEDVTYKTVIVAWPLLGVGIVLGGVWANEAWGRFWGWDPKETWALITWIVYAGYLHTRITLGWTGKRTAAIAVAAFAVVVFTFMGVNLGLTGDGLHSYGAG